VIDDAQVLHVARLARLELSEQELRRMSVELSRVLEHVERMNELDLDDVAPTTHVVAVDSPLRPDEPRASLSREAVLANAPAVADDGFAVPSPQA